MRKIQTLKAAKVLRKGGVIAHQTSTLAGIAASVRCPAAMLRVQAFKRRTAPFLLLADSMRTALGQAVYIPPKLRKLAKASWPGAVTLVFRAKKRLHPACYQQGCIAVRVDADKQTRQLAKACGGLMLSSSFNRKGKAVMPLLQRTRFRHHQYIQAVLPGRQEAAGKASKIYKITAKAVKQLR